MITKDKDVTDFEDQTRAWWKESVTSHKLLYDYFFNFQLMNKLV